MHSERYIQAIHRDIVEGKRQAVIWGWRDYLGLVRWQQGFPVDAVLDTKWEYWDRVIEGYPIRNPHEIVDYRRDRVAVITLYTQPRVYEYMKKLGYACVPPRPSAEILRRMAPDGGKKMPMTSASFRDIRERLLPRLRDPSALTPDGVWGSGKERKALRNLLSRYNHDDLIYYAASHVRTRHAFHSRRAPRVCLVANALVPGGAERQLVNLAAGFRRIGWDAAILTTMDHDAAPHYADDLKAHDIELHNVHPMAWRSGLRPAFDQLMDVPDDLLMALWHLPTPMLARLPSTVHFLRTYAPDFLICYLDWPNTIAGLAGLFAGVPKILLSGRNHNPTEFPHFYGGATDDMRRIYKILMRHDDVVLTNNSPNGAESYAKWLNAPTKSISFVPNCLGMGFEKAPAPPQRRATRRKLGVKTTTPVIVGIFRLAPEKRPLLFVKIIDKLRRKIPDLHAFICGDGMMRPEVEKDIAKRKLGGHITLLGPRKDVRDILAAADLMLHTAEYEGMPNVILEAQAQALPVVATEGGGVEICLSPALHPYKAKRDDDKGMVKSCLTLLNDPALRRKIGTAARRDTLKSFSLAKLVERTAAAARIDLNQGKRTP